MFILVGGEKLEIMLNFLRNHKFRFYLFLILLLVSGVGVAVFLRFSPTNRNQEIEEIKTIVGIIAPHHLLVEKQNIISLKKIQRQFPNQPRKIVVLVPNHDEKGGNKFIIPDNQFYFWQQYANNLFIASDETVNSEDSVSTWKQIFAHANIDWQMLPVLVSARTKIKDLEQLKTILSKLIDQDYLLVVSIDFSHYLGQKQANINDEITKNLINSFDLEKILTLNNDYVDSNRLLWLTTTLIKDNSFKLNWVWHGNSAEFEPNVNDLNTTSYFITEFLR